MTPSTLSGDQVDHAWRLLAKLPARRHVREEVDGRTWAAGGGY
jgi:hypothetical protein